MDGKKANMIYSDMPYNINLDYDKGFGKNSRYGGNTDDSKSIEEYTKFVRTTIRNGITHCEKDAHIFWYCDEKYIWLVQITYRELGIKCQRVCLWIKNNQNPTPGVAFNKCYEPCIYGTIGNPTINPVNNLTEILSKEVTTGNDSVEEIKDMLDIWLDKRLPTADYSHPTEKPVTLHEKPLRRCSKRGDIVLDLFAGSGSSMIACEQLGRGCYMVDNEPVFVDLILNRYESFTGNKPIKIACGYVPESRTN
jgi:DNA modification methylase